ncbi:hypothetical protein Nepgr_014360 [Nepenthes gracilis]|uniref:Uncharacterized protein n=1 Tax=Nepenthes gracilis TaxID=150966 RepID=A0AAD3SKR9_NEPGR|nr:hypothetical protein Nepgr_014360 [Nepenthes gracilis]
MDWAPVRSAQFCGSYSCAPLEEARCGSSSKARGASRHLIRVGEATLHGTTRYINTAEHVKEYFDQSSFGPLLADSRGKKSVHHEHLEAENRPPA